jgi:hypothetical protein
MEITTLIKWNGLIYVLYYALNFAYDYIRTSKSQKEQSVQYSYQNLIRETPSVVNISTKSSEKNPVATAIREKAQTAEIKKEASSPITFEGPVEDQSLPMEEFLKTSKSFSRNINF